MIKSLSHICLATHQLENLIEFYCGQLDCHIVHEFRNDQGERYGAFLAVGNSKTFIELFNQMSDRPIKAGGAFRHICFEVDNVVEMAAKFTARGTSANVKRGRTDGVYQFTINDPDGNEIEFHQYDEACVLWSYLESVTKASEGSS